LIEASGFHRLSHWRLSRALLRRQSVDNPIDRLIGLLEILPGEIECQDSSHPGAEKRRRHIEDLSSGTSHLGKRPKGSQQQAEEGAYKDQSREVVLEVPFPPSFGDCNSALTCIPH
jgi:hypothetical protein